MRYKVYLAGPMKGLTHEESDSWRKTFKCFLNSKIDTMSPTRGNKAFKPGEKIADHYKGHPLSDPIGINTRDMNDVRRSDLVVAYLNVKTPAIGTIMEIAWARAFNKPVVIIMADEFKDTVNNHAMVLYNAIVVDDEMDAAMVVNDILCTDQEIEEFPIYTKTEFE